MPEISSKKKFIKRNYKQLSLEELARHTGLKLDVIRSLINEYTSEIPGKDQSAQIKKNTLSFPSWKTILVTSLLFAAAAFIIYSPSLHGDFVFDDNHNILDNPLVHIEQLSQLPDLLFSHRMISLGKNRRIGLMSFALNYYFGGLNPFGYHLVNVIIHAFNGIILFLLSFTILTLPLNEGKERGDALKIAFLGSLLWLVHPIQTQAVSYIVQRLTSLSALFFLLSLFCYIKGRLDQTFKRLFLFSLSILLGLLALGTKQNAATLPFFIILSEFFFLQHQPFKMDRKKFIFLITFVGLFILVAGVYLGPDFISKLTLGYEKRGWTPLERVLTQLRVVVFYLALLIYPHPSRLNLDHDFGISRSLSSPFTTFSSLLVIIGLIALAIFFIKRNRLVSFAIFWFFGNLVIESSIIPLELVFEHRLYLPSMGPIIVVVGLCFSLSKRVWGKWVIALVIPFILLFSYWTYERALVWRGPFSLWLDVSQKSPSKARPHNSLGNAYADKGMLSEAIEEYKQALVLNPRHALAHNNLGNAYHKKGMLDKAIFECKKAIAISPNYAAAHYNLGLTYGKKGRLDEAIYEFKKALAINPNLAEAHSNLGFSYFGKGMVDEAILEYNKSIAIDPNIVKTHYNLGLAYGKKGRLDEAIYEFKKALAINPNLAEVYNSLGAALKIQGKESDEINAYSEAIRFMPDNHEAYNALAWIYATSPNAAIRNGDEAMALATKACELTGFKKAEVVDTLAAAYAEQGRFDKAVEYQYKAIELAPLQIKKELQKHLQLYKSGSPLHSDQ